MLTKPQSKLLNELARRGGASEMFAPSRPVVNALRKRGYITERFIGQRWTYLRLTEAGNQAIQEA